ncbi:unnamed protein product [Brassica oleracea var. botrytis]|uniref:Uncharacterized protein n=1 Tax=Brassica oleracea TaxID=3712 RepID=A0A3P6EV29_BRAOL|nr:unnamed protein product [Brassica oleracea]
MDLRSYIFTRRLKSIPHLRKNFHTTPIPATETSPPG